MSKRYQPPKDFKNVGRMSKKPRLDVSVNKSRVAPATNIISEVNRITIATTTASRTNNVATHVPAPSPAAAPDKEKEKSGANIYWDDFGDDDDVLLLATQAAEKAIPAASFGLNAAKRNELLESELTFSEFVPPLGASTSTQQMPKPKQNFSELFDDDDDDALLAAASGEKESEAFKKPAVEVFKKPAVEPFKKPAAPLNNKTNANVKPAVRMNDSKPLVSMNAAMPTTSAESQRAIANERQTKYLREHLENLNKQNAKLNNELSEAKSKLESKSGEASLLRDEMRNLKQQVQTLKMDKIISTEAAKSECQTQIAKLSKEVEARKTELQLKAVEVSVMKMRHADQTQRFENMSMREPTSPYGAQYAAVAGDDVEIQEQHAALSVKQLRLMRLNALDMSELIIADGALPNHEFSEMVFAPTDERTVLRKQRTVFHIELGEMQTVVAQMQVRLQQQYQLNDVDTAELSTRIINSISKVLPEFLSYVHTLVYPHYSGTFRYGGQERWQRGAAHLDLNQPGALIKGERGIYLRRYIAALSVAFSQLPTLSRTITRTYTTDDYPLLQYAIDGIRKLAYSRELKHNFLILEAFAYMLLTILRTHQQFAATSATSVATQTNASQKNSIATAAAVPMEVDTAANADMNHVGIALLIDFMKHIVFVRPPAYVLGVIAQCLWECVRFPYSLSLLCVNSDPRQFRPDRVHKVYQYRNDSCFLQVYASFLESTFPLNCSVELDYYQLLTVICFNHVRFAFHCFQQRPFFILSCASIDDDDDADAEQDVENAAEVTANSTADAPTISSNSFASTRNNSKAAAASTAEEEEQTTNNNKYNRKRRKIKCKCQCYRKLCLSTVTLIFKLLRQWLEFQRETCTAQIIEISKIAVQLLHIIFCENISETLFRYAEVTTKHHLWLICHWWHEHAQLLEFNELQLNLLQKLRSSRAMPKELRNMENLAHHATDMEIWHRLTSEPKACDNSNNNSLSNSIHLLDDVTNPDDFFKCFQGYAFNFE